MSNKNPFFSVVIPTRNRANLLYLAVKSILGQSFEDLEIIVSDNFSSDNTAEVIHSIKDERVKYFRSSRSLTMNESYKFALSHASGEYITFLSDDDAFTVSALEKAKKIISETKTELLVWKYAFYYPQERLQMTDYPAFHPLRRIKNNTVLIPTFCNQLFEVGAGETIERILLHNKDQNFSLTNPDYRAAFLTNAVYHRTIFEKIKNKRLDFFPNYVIPDIYAFMLTLCAVENYFYLDAPLTIFCKSSVSTTESKIDKLSFHKSLITGKKEPFINFAPLKNLINQNYIIESSLQALDEIGGEYENFQLNKEKYYQNTFDDLLYYEKHGIEVESELSELRSVLAEESDELNLKINFKISNGESRNFLKLIRKFPRPSFLTQKMAYLKPESTHTRTIIIQGKHGYFNDIFECSNWLDSNKIDSIADFCLAMQNSRKKELPFKWQID